MERLRSIQLDMLCELDQLCREHNIPYILSGYTARAAARGQGLSKKVAVPTIAMRYTDAIRLARLCTGPERTVEHALSNRRLSRIVMRYARPDTTCIRVDEWNRFRHPGICVDIELIRPVPGKGAVNKLWKLLEAFVTITAELRCLPGVWRLFLPILVPVEKLALNMAYCGRPFGGSSKVRIARFPQKSVEFPSELLTDRQQLHIEGMPFYVSRDLEKYLSLEFDNTRPQDDPELALEDMALTVVDSQTPCAQSLTMLREIYGKGPEVNWLHRFVLRGRMRFLRQKIQKYWDLLYLTRDRFVLWKQLMPEKKVICEQFRCGDLAAVRTGLSTYLTALNRNLKKDLALCFDAELFEIALSLLKVDGREDDAQRLRNLVFPEHLKPLKIEGFEYD